MTVMTGPKKLCINIHSSATSRMLTFMLLGLCFCGSNCVFLDLVLVYYGKNNMMKFTSADGNTRLCDKQGNWHTPVPVLDTCKGNKMHNTCFVTSLVASWPAITGSSHSSGIASSTSFQVQGLHAETAALLHFVS